MYLVSSLTCNHIASWRIPYACIGYIFLKWGHNEATMRPCFSTSWATYTTHEYITPSLQPKILCIYTYIYCVHVYLHNIDWRHSYNIYIYILYIYTYTHTCTSILHKYSASLSPHPVDSVTPVHEATCRSMAHKLSERAPAIQVRLHGLWWPYQ